MATRKTTRNPVQGAGRGNRRYVPVNVVNVYLWGQHVGAVAERDAVDAQKPSGRYARGPTVHWPRNP